MRKKYEIENNTEIKQSFLSSAITDISAYIQLADTKVSIIMASVVAIMVGLLTCYEPISALIADIKPCTWIGVSFIIVAILGIVSVISVFIFGILTIRGHSSVIGYKSKWFLAKSTKEYSFNEFSKDIQKMNDEDVIKNMAAELYKLNDINRQKMKTMKWSLRAFSVMLISIVILTVLFLVKSL